MSGSLADSPATVILYMLEDQSLGMHPGTGQGESDWPIFRGILPNKPDNVILVSDTVGLEDGRHHIDGEQQEYFGVSLLVRSNKYETAYDKAKAIKDNLNETIYRTSVSFSSKTYLVQEVTTTSGPVDAGKEQGSQRRLCSLSLLIDLKQTT